MMPAASMAEICSANSARADPTFVTQRMGLTRFPALTACVLVATAAVSASQFAEPAVLRVLERTPAGLSGEWWRSFTALFVQDGGLAGTIVNLAFLIVIGSIAEQVFDRLRWLLLYFIPALAGEFAAYAWQPIGAGNSVAVCGLAGGLILIMLTGAARVPRPTPIVMTCWIGLLAATIPEGSWAALAILAFGIPAVQIMRHQGWPADRIVAAAGLAEAIVMIFLRNIHGAAQFAGIVLAGVLLR
jgi:membrane associated rhomboid family serine protease